MGTVTKLKTTGKVSWKPYKCNTCGHTKSQQTNHWGEFYNTQCPKCGVYSTWTCLEPAPEGYTKPAPWKSVTLGDIAKD